MEAKTKASSGLAWLFPVGAFVLLPAAFLIGYGIGVTRDDIEVVWPFVSDTGATPPESCIFGQLVNMSAGLMMVSLYLRHRHVMAFYKATKHKRRGIVISSRVFLGVGIFAAFGLMLVANFQEQQVIVSPVHYIGAGIAFVLGLAYAWYQSILSFMTPRTFTPRLLAWIRLLISIFGTICFVGVFARNMDPNYGPNFLPTADPTSTTTVSHPKHYYRGPGDPGYAAFLITTISEWCLAFCLAFFFLTLAFDLRKVGRVYPPRLSLFTVDKLESPPPMIIETENQSRIFAFEQELPQSPPQPQTPAPRPQYHEQAHEIHPIPRPKVIKELSDVLDPLDQVEYRPEIKHKVKKIPLPGMTNDPVADMETYLDHSGADVSAPTPGTPGTPASQKPRGLRRSYDNAINGARVDELPSPMDDSRSNVGSSRV